DQEEALDLADRVVILDRGRIVQEGTPREICRNPKSAFVARFLGDANRLTGKVGGGRAILDNVVLDVDYVPDGEAEIFIRPTDLVWNGEGDGLAVTVHRIFDRPHGRRIQAVTATGNPLEF